MKCILDAGHGKSTAGKRSFDGSLLEWEFNRDVTQRIKSHLECHGVTVVLTAPGEEDVSLPDRVQIANHSKADVLVSIHANAYGKEWNTANGWEIYIHQGSVRGNQLAEAIRKQSIPFLGLKDRGIKTDLLYVTRNTIMPAVLVEHGFYTNLEELELLKTDEFRAKCALADAKGILDYFGAQWKEPEPDYKSLYEKTLKDLFYYKGLYDAEKSKTDKIREFLG